MDPLSITASLLAVIGAAKAGANGVRKLSNYRKAPRELADLLSELESLQEILSDIKLFSDLYPDALFGEGLYECVQSSASKIAAINDLVASNPFKLTKLSDDNHARVVWVRYKQTLLDLRNDLQVLRMDLAVRIGLVKALSSCRVEESLGVSIRAQKEISEQLSTIVGMMTPVRTLQDESSSTTLALDSPSSGVTVRSPRFNSNSNQAQSGQVTIGSSTAGSSRLGEASLNHQSELVQDMSPNFARQKCQAWCSCVCHTRSVVKSPLILETIIGRINVQYVGMRPACNEFHCLRLPEISFKMVYQFPKYIMKRYISMVMHQTPLSGPEFLLRMPRMVSWSHVLWNYANNGELSAIQKLFAEGKASPYDISPHGSSVLWYTVNRHHSQLTRFLLDQGVDSDHPNNIGRTPSDLLWEHSVAGEFGSEGISVIGSMLKDTDHVQTQGFSTLHKIVLGIIPKDLESELDISTAGINEGDSRNRTPLYWATIRNDLQAVKTLLAFGANPNIVDKWGHSPLDFVRSIGICKMLLDAGVNIHASNYGRSALHQLFQHTGTCFLESDTVDMIDLLVNAGIDVDVRDRDGETPLLNAVYSGHTPHVRRLLELGANPNASNLSSRQSTIHFAVLFDRHDIIPLLLEHGADYTAVNNSGENIAHVAAWSADTKTISVLTESNLVKLDMHLRNKEGKTPADHLSERSILTNSEQGLHAEFERFMKSVPMTEADTPDGPSRAAAVHKPSDAYDNLHLPGAYPEDFK